MFVYLHPNIIWCHICKYSVKFHLFCLQTCGFDDLTIWNNATRCECGTFSNFRVHHAVWVFMQGHTKLGGLHQSSWPNSECRIIVGHWLKRGYMHDKCFSATDKRLVRGWCDYFFYFIRFFFSINNVNCLKYNPRSKAIYPQAPSGAAGECRTSIENTVVK